MLRITAWIALILPLSTLRAHTPESEHPLPRDGGLSNPDPDRLGALRIEAARSLAVRECGIIKIDTPPQPPPVWRAAVWIDGLPRTLRLEPSSVRSERFEVRAARADGTFDIVPPGPSMTMRGVVEEIDGARVAASLCDAGVTASIHLPDGSSRWIEPLVGRLPRADIGDHAIYRASDVLDLGARCATNEAAPPNRAIERGGYFYSFCEIDICVAEVAIDADHAYYLLRGGDVEAVRHAVEEILNTVDLQFEAEVEIQHRITMLIVRTEPGLYVRTNVGEMMQDFKRQWDDHHTDIERDLVHLLTGTDLDGNLIGLAYMSSVCTPNAFAISQPDYTPNFAFRTDLVAHELGHNWGAHHCSCFSYTMNDFITGGNRFHPTRSIPSIVAFRRTRQCLGTGGAAREGLPFIDHFDDSTAIDPLRWDITTQARINTRAINIPTRPYALNLNGPDVVQSVRIDGAFATGMKLSYYWQRKGLGDEPEPGDDLVVEYLGELEGWIELRRHRGDGPTVNGFTEEHIPLPPAAEHRNLRIRFRTLGQHHGYDDWFVDHVRITGVPVPPGPFSIIQPQHGAVGLPSRITFSWQPSERAIGYILLIDDDPSFTSPILVERLGPDQTSLERVYLEPRTTYYWRVLAANPNGIISSLPDEARFTTTLGPPGPFSLVRPLGGVVSLAQPATGELMWSAAAEAEDYLLLIDDDEDFSSPEVVQIWFPTAGAAHEVYTPPPGLLVAGRQYHWRVDARNGYGVTRAEPDSAGFFVVPGVPTCTGDVDQNGRIDSADITFVVHRMGSDDPMADVDNSGLVDVNDLAFILVRLGSDCP